MKAEIRWENDARTVLRYTYSGEWNWDDFYKTLEWRDPDDPTRRDICVIVDLRQTPRPPSDAILHLKNPAKRAEEIDGLIILIVNSAALVTLYNVFIMMYRKVAKRFRLVSNIKEAYELLGLPYNEEDEQTG